MYKFIVCAIFKNESHVLNEWIRHYLFHGADHIYLVNDNSTDSFQEIVDKYADQVTLFHSETSDPVHIANTYFLPLRNNTKWMTVLDMKQFLYSPYEVDLRIALEKYEFVSHIEVDWLEFGRNDHTLQPHVVTEGFVKRAVFEQTHTSLIVNSTGHGIHYHAQHNDEAPPEFIINYYSTEGKNEIVDTRLAEQNRPFALELKQAKVTGADTVTLVMTTSNNPAHLEQTLASFLRHNTYPIQEALILDDSGIIGCNKQVLKTFRDTLNIKELYNTNLSQVESIDKVYSYVTTPYIFHCDENWEFIESGFIEKSMKLFNENPDEKLFTVWLNSHDDTNKHPIEYDEKGMLILKKKFTYIENGHPFIWGGITFNPGLRRTDVCFLHHPYMTHCTPTRTKERVHLGEYSVNKKYRESGYYSAILELPSGHVRRIGHITDKSANTLYVSSYFTLQNKHTTPIDTLWRFFHSMRSKPVLFFCDAETHDLVKTFGIDMSNVSFSLCEFKDLPILQKFPKPFWNKHAKLDTDLAMLRANKKECLRLAKENKPDYTWYIWIDVLCIETDDPHISEFGERHTFSPGVYIQALKEIPTEREVFRHEERFVSGTIVLVHKDYVDRYAQCYNKMALAYEGIHFPPTSDTSILLSLSKKESWIHPVYYESPRKKYGVLNKRAFFLQTI